MASELKKLYESLLNEKAALEKECEHINREYIRFFGEDIKTQFELKVEAITLKKKIAYCVKKKYANEKIYSDELDAYIDEEIASYQNQLRELVEMCEYAKEKGSTIAFDEAKKIKKLYYRIAHLIHPDLHPEYKDDVVIFDLWNKSVDAYKRNDYEVLSEAYDQIIMYVGENDIEIPDIEEKINKVKKEIEEIKSDTPYTYKFMLDDPDECNAFKEELQKEIIDYQEYIESLKKELNNFPIIERGDA